MYVGFCVNAIWIYTLFFCQDFSVVFDRKHPRHVHSNIEFGSVSACLGSFMFCDAEDAYIPNFILQRTVRLHLAIVILSSSGSFVVSWGILPPKN